MIGSRHSVCSAVLPASESQRGPIVGGFFTTNLSWRWVFVGEVLIACIIVLAARLIVDAKLAGRRPNLDIVGSVLSAIGSG